MAQSRTGAFAGTSMLSTCVDASACWLSTATAGTRSCAPVAWADISGLFREGVLESLTAAGFSRGQVKGYLGQAGVLKVTRTHGRREGAFLNRAWEDVLTLDLCLDTASHAQPLLDHAVNTRPSRCAGFDGLGTGLERIAYTLESER